MKFKKTLLVTVCVGAAFLGLTRAYITPVLVYHHIADGNDDSVYSVSPESFRKQMEFLKSHRYQVLSLRDYVYRLNNRKPVPMKSVVITFDMGYEDNFLNAFPILKKMDFPATVFVQVDGIGRDGYMSHEDIGILLDNKIDIGSLTLHHSHLPGASQELLNQEIVDSKSILERRFQRHVNIFSYPGGKFDAPSRQKVIEAGYAGAVAMRPGARYPNRDPYALKRVPISGASDNLFVFWLKTSGFYSYLDDLRG